MNQCVFVKLNSSSLFQDLAELEKLECLPALKEMSLTNNPVCRSSHSSSTSLFKHVSIQARLYIYGGISLQIVLGKKINTNSDLDLFSILDLLIGICTMLSVIQYKNTDFRLTDI